MPLLKTAVQLGGAAALLNAGAKALDRHEKTRYEHDLQLQQQQQMQQQAPIPSCRSAGSKIALAIRQPRRLLPTPTLPQRLLRRTMQRPQQLPTPILLQWHVRGAV